MLVITSPKASGSASSHEWLPSTTSPGRPIASQRASKLARGTMLSALAPDDHDGGAPPLQDLDLRLKVGPAGKHPDPPEGARVAEGVRDGVFEDDGERLAEPAGRHRPKARKSLGAWRANSQSGRWAWVMPPTELMRTIERTMSG